ncbi:hypothetical protein Y1Q_0007486 [Alligator mississippiensis]|uniref:Uncharacterized protein n=1 Tax=Alligator mississippiensis TaxID=8496 RepID=A0A151M4V2_ALLMI|nr:hypothetical protein Y1Q_0007486 [Alligator mississippiensis]
MDPIWAGVSSHMYTLETRMDLWDVVLVVFKDKQCVIPVLGKEEGSGAEGAVQGVVFKCKTDDRRDECL